jgi:hypothetical protein
MKTAGQYWMDINRLADIRRWDTSTPLSLSKLDKLRCSPDRQQPIPSPPSLARNIPSCLACWVSKMVGRGSVPAQGGVLIWIASFSPTCRALAGEESSHSQITKTRQPPAINAALTLASRVTFLSNFSIQNLVLLFGVVAILQPSCLCQKQPWTKTTVLYRGNTRSGFPGSFDPWRR